MVDQTGEAEVGDGEVFAALYPQLRRFAAAVRPPWLDPDDVVQEALARTLASRSLASLDDPRGYLRRAILAVAMNEHRSRKRHRARMARLGLMPTISADVYPSDLAELMRLSPRIRAALFLHVVEGLPYENVAEILGCRPAAARKAGSRGLASLRVALTNSETEEVP